MYTECDFGQHFWSAPYVLTPNGAMPSAGTVLLLKKKDFFFQLSITSKFRDTFKNRSRHQKCLSKFREISRHFDFCVTTAHDCIEWTSLHKARITFYVTFCTEERHATYYTHWRYSLIGNIWRRITHRFVWSFEAARVVKMIASLWNFLYRSNHPSIRPSIHPPTCLPAYGLAMHQESFVTRFNFNTNVRKLKTLAS